MKTLNLSGKSGCFGLKTVLLPLCMLAVMMLAPQVMAETITVNSCDTVPGTCTLSDAITAANTDTATGGCAAGNGDDTIIFAASLSGQIITLTSALDNLSNITIDGSALASHVSISGNKEFPVFCVSGAAVVVLNHLDIINGGYDTVAEVIGIGINNGGTLTVSNCTLSGNQGGIYNNLNCTATVNNCTFSGNTTRTGDWGGGIYNRSNASLTVNNSTFSGNSADLGGGIYNNGGTLEVNNSTFSGNSNGGIYNDWGSLTLTNSIIADSTGGGDCSIFGEGTVTGSNNLIKKDAGNACGLVDGTNGNKIGVDPLLGALASNGGSTQTMALQAGSPAINAGDAGSCAAAPINNFDQRGYPRVGTCDIGAFEYVPPPITAGVSIVSVSNITGSTAFATGTATGTGITERGFYWWIPPTAENHFGGSESGLLPEGGAGAGSFSLNITGLKPGNTYHIKAYVKVGGQIISSDEQLFTTPTTGPTGKTSPTVSTTICTLNADGTVTAAGQITDVGTSPVNVYGFLYAKHPAPFTGDNGDAALAMWDKTPLYQSLSFTGTIRNLAPGKWYLRAYAHNDNPDSDAAQTASLAYGEDCTFTVPGDVPLPAAPGGLTAIAVSQTQINLLWTDNSSNETGFKIFRNGVELTPSPKVGANTTAFSDTGLTCGTTYTYTVKAVNADGDSAGVTATATTFACTVTIPAAPGGLTATAVSQTQINLLWTDNSSNETGFKIFRDGVELLPSPKVGANVTTFSDTGLTCGTTYTYTVKAVNADGDSAGVTATATTFACTVTIPAAPGGLTATAVSQTQIDLLWTDNSSNETGFKIFRDGVELLPSPKVGANVTTFSDTGVICATTYTYTVKATNAAGDSAGVTASATTPACPYVPPTYYETGSTPAVPLNQPPVADILYVSTEMNSAITDSEQGDSVRTVFCGNSASARHAHRHSPGSDVHAGSGICRHGFFHVQNLERNSIFGTSPDTDYCPSEHY